jgi:hypothetical protein
MPPHPSGKTTVIASESEAIQNASAQRELDCFVAALLAMTEQATSGVSLQKPPNLTIIVPGLQSGIGPNFALLRRSENLDFW